MNTKRQKTRHTLSALFVLAALAGSSACSGDPMGPEAPADFAAPSYAVSASPSTCSVVDGVWVCSGTGGTATTLDDGPRCYLFHGVWVCEPTES